MGKHEDSKLHSVYSKWHWMLTKQDPKYHQLLCTDLDRSWIEYSKDTGQPILAFIDLKQDMDNQQHDLQPNEAERFRYDWFVKNGAKVYILRMRLDNPFAEHPKVERFRVQQWRTNEPELVFTPDECAEWLLALRSPKPQTISDDELDDLLNTFGVSSV